MTIGFLSSQVLSDSHARCLHRHRLDRTDTREPRLLPPQLLNAARERQAQVLLDTREELQRLFSTLCQARYAALIADRDGVVTWRHALPDDEAHLESQGVRVGSDWRESQEGTNSIGTCLELEQPLSVHRREHFKTRHAELSACAAPVRTATGEIGCIIAAVACNPEIASGSHALALAAIEATARAIEERTFRAAYADCWILLLNDEKNAARRAFLALDANLQLIAGDYYAHQSLCIQAQFPAIGSSLGELFADAEVCRRVLSSSTKALSLRRKLDGALWNCILIPPCTHGWPRIVGDSQCFRLYSGSPNGLLPAELKVACRGGLSTRASQRVRDYINDHLAYDMPLEDLAGIAEVSLSHFSREFKRTFGLSPHQYIVVKRVERAAQLITTTRSFFSEIAIEVGFSDQSHFSRSFRHVLKMTPREFKRTLPHIKSPRRLSGGHASRASCYGATV